MEVSFALDLPPNLRRRDGARRAQAAFRLVGLDENGRRSCRLIQRTFSIKTTEGTYAAFYAGL